MNAQKSQVMRTRDALFTVVVYLLLGAVGVPVFSGFQGGVGVLLGPTGGYLLGFAVVPFVVPDAIKVALSVGVAERVNRALGATLER